LLDAEQRSLRHGSLMDRIVAKARHVYSRLWNRPVDWEVDAQKEIGLEEQRPEGGWKCWLLIHEVWLDTNVCLRAIGVGDVCATRVI
jgi:hypothetical protein